MDFSEFISSAGRLNRLPYFIRVMVLGVLQKYLFKVATADGTQLGFISSGLFYITTIAIAILITLQVIKRLHDLEKSGWYALLLLIPIVNLALGLFLTFRKGTHGPNSFGPDPIALGIMI